VKLNASILAMLTVATLAVLATTYRVSTAPERIRDRHESAKATCISNGGQWLRVDGVESCQPAADRK
jgi:hypothetical protein